MDKEFRKKLFAIVIPIAFQQLLLAAVSAGDSLMLGFVNGDAMAAVSFATNIEFIENLFLSASVCGLTIISAQYFGKGDGQTISRMFGLALRYTVVISVLFTVTAVLFPERLMRLFTNEDELILHGVEYIRMAVGSYLLGGVTQCFLCVMKATGKTKQSVYIGTFALVLDTVLNAIFIFVFDMGAAGAALTTTITRTIELIIVLVYSRHVSIRPMIFAKVSPALHRDFLRCSVPHLINSLLWGVGTAVYSSIIGHLGTAIATAYSAAAIVRNLSVFLSRGLGQGTEIVLAEILGSGKLDEGRLRGGQLGKFSVICGFFCSAFALLFGRILMNFMTLTEEACHDLQIMIYISTFYVFTQCISIVVVCGIFTAGGDTAFDAYSVAVTMWLIIIPLALAAAFWQKLSPLTVYFILSMDEIVKTPWIYAHYKKYKWLNNITREEST